MIKAGKNRAEIYISDTIEYYVKSSHVKVTLVKRTKTRVKGLTVNRSQKKRWHGQRVRDAMKQT